MRDIHVSLYIFSFICQADKNRSIKMLMYLMREHGNT